MKRYQHFCALSLLALAACGVASAQLPTAIQRFDEATHHYAQGEYREAIRGYEDVMALGYATGALFYNTGNAYFRVDEYGQALRYWEKARRLMGDDPALVHNIEIVRARIGTPFSSVPPPFWVAWWERIVMPVGAMLYLVLGILLYFIAAVLFAKRIWTGTRSAWPRRARVGSLVLGAALLCAAFGVSAGEVTVRSGVVVTRSVELAETPGSIGTVDVPEGVVVSISGHADDHYRIKLPNGTVGYLPDAAVGEI